jgi:hypothetical protein
MIEARYMERSLNKEHQALKMNGEGASESEETERPSVFYTDEEHGNI